MIPAAIHPVRTPLPVLGGVLAIALVANCSLSISYAALITTLSSYPAASTRTALLLNMWALALIFSSHRYPRLIQRHGTRVCAPMALLLSSVAIALLAIPGSFGIWLLAECLQGVAFGLFYVTIESWINSAFAQHLRNRVNALYLAVQSLGFAAGPMFVNASEYAPATLFLIAATAMALAALLGWTLLAKEQAAAVSPAPPSLVEILGISRRLPWIVLLGMLTGALDNAAWSLLAPYLQTTGFSNQASLLALTVFLWGQVILLLPLGYFADRAGEMKLLRLMSAFVMIYCLVMTQVANLPANVFLALTFVFGPACFSIYAAVLSLASKCVKREEMPLASASLVTAWCLGGFAGSVLVGTGMDFLHARVFPIALLIFAIGMIVIVTRMVPKPTPQIVITQP